MNCEPQSEVELHKDMAKEEGSRDVDCLPLEDAKTNLEESTQSVNVLKTVDLDTKQQPSNDSISGDGENLHKINKEISHKSNKGTHGDYKVASPDHEKKTDTTSGKASCLEKDQNRKESDQETTTSQTSDKKEPTKDTEEEEKGESHFSENLSTDDLLGSEPHESISSDGDNLHDTDMKTTNKPHMEIHGDYKGESPEHEKMADTNHGCCSSSTAEENHIRKKTRGSQIPDKREEEDIDGPKAEINEEFSTNKDTESCEDATKASASEAEPDEQKNSVSLQQRLLQDVPLVESERQRHVETLGPTTAEAAESRKFEFLKGRDVCVIVVVSIVVLVLAYLVKLPRQTEAPPPKNNQRHIDDFLKKMEKVTTQYPNQRSELWNRSRIHLKRHLQTSQPTEPVSLILTAGLRAERTLHCLAKHLSYAFSSAINTSVLHIDGASKANQNSDQVKLDIDNKLQGAFEGNKHVAVIHRFEELPPGSTLIFYRYCDHENAAYKKTFLIFTVLLGEEKDIPAETHLSDVEEMVDDHLQKKFLSHGHPVSFDSMDFDKYGGLWSRISHLILPVAAEERIELVGC
uniref:Torsin A interacting protein 2 n=1 Tax=Iconisemion striatum TaxID=60296 RepID=A0A1A7XA23_9TELE